MYFYSFSIVECKNETQAMYDVSGKNSWIRSLWYLFILDCFSRKIVFGRVRISSFLERTAVRLKVADIITVIRSYAALCNSAKLKLDCVISITVF